MTRSFRYGGERWWKILCTAVATLKIMRNFIGSQLFESRSDVRPTTKAENETSGCILDPLERRGYHYKVITCLRQRNQNMTEMFVDEYRKTPGMRLACAYLCEGSLVTMYPQGIWLRSSPT